MLLCVAEKVFWSAARSGNSGVLSTTLGRDDWSADFHLFLKRHQDTIVLSSKLVSRFSLAYQITRYRQPVT